MLCSMIDWLVWRLGWMITLPSLCGWICWYRPCGDHNVVVSYFKSLVFADEPLDLAKICPPSICL